RHVEHDVEHELVVRRLGRVKDVELPLEQVEELPEVDVLVVPLGKGVGHDVSRFEVTAYWNGLARSISSSSPGSLGLMGLPGWMIDTWQLSAASTSCRYVPAARSAIYACLFSL